MLFKNSPEKIWDLIASKYAASSISDKQALEKNEFSIIDKTRFSSNSDSEFTLIAKKK